MLGDLDQLLIQHAKIINRRSLMSLVQKLLVSHEHMRQHGGGSFGVLGLIAHIQQVCRVGGRDREIVADQSNPLRFRIALQVDSILFRKLLERAGDDFVARHDFDKRGHVIVGTAVVMSGVLGNTGADPYNQQ